MCRSYHLLATASKDRTERIWKLKMLDGTLQCEVEEVAKQLHHESEVWRVEWNVTGTMLASSGDDGTVRMWKSDFEVTTWTFGLLLLYPPTHSLYAWIQGNWVCVNTVCGDLSMPILANSGP